MELLDNIAKKHNHNSLMEYLDTRNLELVSDMYYCNGILYRDVLYSGLFIVTYSTQGTVALIENRSLGGVYTKIHQSEYTIPLWNINRIKDKKVIVITEAVIDAESINQILTSEDVIAISTFRASFTLAQFHFLMFLTSNTKLITAFDNDEAGVKATGRFESMAKEKYGVDVEHLSYPYNDINVFKCKSRRFKNLMNQSLKDFV